MAAAPHSQRQQGVHRQSRQYQGSRYKVGAVENLLPLHHQREQSAAVAQRQEQVQPGD